MGVVVSIHDRIDRDLTTRPVNPVGAYLDRLAPGSRRTMRQSLRYMAQEFSGGTRDETSFEWAKLRYEHTTRMRASLAQRYAPATANKMLSALRGVLTECWRLGQMGVEELARAKDIEPVQGTKLPKGRALTIQEINTLLGYGGSLPHTELMRFMMVTGLRRAEVSAIRWEDINEGIITVKGKGNKERKVPIPANVLLDLGGRRTAGERTGRIFPISPGRIWHVLREAAFQAGLPPLSPHDLRRTYATRMLGKGVDLATVQRLMGHSSPRTTAGYDLRSAIEDSKAVEDVWGNL